MAYDIGKIVIDATGAKTDLCRLGAAFGTDKSPYTTTGDHRHPYTAAYNLLFASLRHRDIVFGELGILDNSSMKMWRAYFTSAQLYGFEVDPERINKAIGDGLFGCHYAHANVIDERSMFDAFNNVGRLFDVLIDDSTHLFEHQINFVATAIQFMKPGGLIIVEDIFRPWPAARYLEALIPQMKYLETTTFLETNHENAFSGGTQEPYYDNDTLLVLTRNRHAYERV